MMFDQEEEEGQQKRVELEKNTPIEKASPKKKTGGKKTKIELAKAK